MRLLRASVITACMLAGSLPAFADPIRCTTFLQNRDGTWRSFNEADVDGPDGILHLHAGEILRPSDKSPKGEVARVLSDMCGH